jgi:hypothetical protein
MYMKVEGGAAAAEVDDDWGSSAMLFAALKYAAGCAEEVHSR